VPYKESAFVQIAFGNTGQTDMALLQKVFAILFSYRVFTFEEK